MKTFNICYKFDGEGEVEIKAKNEEEARGLFDERDWEGNEWSENTSLESIEEIK